MASSKDNPVKLKFERLVCLEACVRCSRVINALGDFRWFATRLIRIDRGLTLSAPVWSACVCHKMNSCYKGSAGVGCDHKTRRSRKWHQITIYKSFNWWNTKFIFQYVKRLDRFLYLARFIMPLPRIAQQFFLQMIQICMCSQNFDHNSILLFSCDPPAMFISIYTLYHYDYYLIYRQSIGS